VASLTKISAEEVERFARKVEEIFYEGDGRGMASYYTENARLMADGIEPLRGRHAIEAFWQATCERAKSIDMKRTIHVEDVQASDEISYAVCTLTIEVRIPNGGIITKTVKDITIWRKQADGTWQIEVDISNQNPQSSPRPLGAAGEKDRRP
jgi:uncharacterized protein (TIGR02246 family)